MCGPLSMVDMGRVLVIATLGVFTVAMAVALRQECAPAAGVDLHSMAPALLP